MKKFTLILAVAALSLNAFSDEHLNNSSVLKKATLVCTKGSEVSIELKLETDSKGRVLSGEFAKVSLSGSYAKFKKLETQDGYRSNKSGLWNSASGPGDGKGISSMKLSKYLDETSYPYYYSQGLVVNIDGFRKMSTTKLSAFLDFSGPKPGRDKFEPYTITSTSLDCSLL